MSLDPMRVYRDTCKDVAMAMGRAAGFHARSGQSDKAYRIARSAAHYAFIGYPELR